MQGRYIAGVCAALGRATNTDPVLWRVLLAVLGFFGGVGILLYLIGWLLIPAEGDTASPIESLLGRGRSGMSPLSVRRCSAAAAVLSFAFIVHDGFRAALLAAAVDRRRRAAAQAQRRDRPVRGGRPPTVPGRRRRGRARHRRRPAPGVPATPGCAVRRPGSARRRSAPPAARRTGRRNR